MLELLFAILIALGFNFDRSLTADELKAKDPVAYERAVQIESAGNYRTVDGGGIVIVEVGGD